MDKKILIKSFWSGWIDVYIDGKKVWGNHNIDPYNLLDLLNIEYEVQDIDDTDDDYEYEGEDGTSCDNLK
jgi:hypothetical protein